MGSHAEEVDWDQLDKTKMFIYGAGMFSGVTVALYPLSVIKTKQMTLPGISGGFQGVRQTTSTIMRTEGIPGFYRGFGTVIFGTIPARGVYLTTLEWTKSETAKVVADLGLTGPAAAGIANFVGGALASLATQSVTVPIDVISQKQIVHGDETVVARHQHSRSPLASSRHHGAATPATSAGSSVAAVASTRLEPGLGAGPAAGGSGSAHGTAVAPESGGHQVATGRTAVAASVPHAGQPTGGGAQTGPGVHGSVTASSPSTASPPGTSPPADVAGRSSSIASCSSSSSSSTGSGSASSSGRPASAPAPANPQPGPSVRRIGSLQMVRLILKEEGMAGLYRGFGASVATFVPSSAVWWGSYGAYQKLIWMVLNSGDQGEKEGQQHRQHTTGEVVTVQTTSSVLAGCTSSLVTTPLDLVKTRIQVSYKHDGATPTFSEVARQIMREDGARGFLRGAVPRMINASLWGTCMVTVYEYLKRISAKDEP